MDEEIKMVILNASEDLRNAVVQKIGSNIPPPNAPTTIKRKGSSKTLIDTGRMWSSIDTKILEESETTMEVGVGIFEPEIAEYALYNEYGTERIPERSFLRSAYDENIETFMNDISEAIGQIFTDKFKK